MTERIMDLRPLGFLCSPCRQHALHLWRPSEPQRAARARAGKVQAPPGMSRARALLKLDRSCVDESLPCACSQVLLAMRPGGQRSRAQLPALAPPKIRDSPRLPTLRRGGRRCNGR